VYISSLTCRLGDPHPHAHLRDKRKLTDAAHTRGLTLSTNHTADHRDGPRQEPLWLPYNDLFVRLVTMTAGKGENWSLDYPRRRWPASSNPHGSAHCDSCCTIHPG
jgi:hypothetical protein